MARNYSDLSRRALIKLGQDYDQNHDAALLQFLTENDKDYEGVRPIESAIERVDQIKETIIDSKSSIKSTIIAQADKMLDTIINTIYSASDTILKLDEESDGF